MYYLRNFYINRSPRDEATSTLPRLADARALEDEIGDRRDCANSTALPQPNRGRRPSGRARICRHRWHTILPEFSRRSKLLTFRFHGPSFTPDQADDELVNRDSRKLRERSAKKSLLFRGGRRRRTVIIGHDAPTAHREPPLPLRRETPRHYESATVWGDIESGSIRDMRSRDSASLFGRRFGPGMGSQDVRDQGPRFRRGRPGRENGL